MAGVTYPTRSAQGNRWRSPSPEADKVGLMSSPSTATALVLATLGLALAAAAPAPAATEPDVRHLPLGDPVRKDHVAPVVLDAVTDTRTGELFTPSELPARLADVRVLFVGENHTSMDFHRVQLQVLRELVASGRPVLVGLEMYPYTQQSFLDDWNRGLLTEEGFLQLSHWYDAWGFPWSYYRDLFVFARDHGVPMFGINTPRQVVTDVREKGFAGLTEEERSHIPETIDTESAEHRRLFRAFFADAADSMHSSMSDEQLDAMYNAQCTWDATMGYNAVRALEEHGKPGAIMVVLIGSGHVAYDLGAQRQAAHWFDGKMASLVPIPVEDSDHQRVADVQASYADFLWGLPPEADPLFPSLGFSTVAASDQDTRRRVIFVPDDSVAAAAGFQVGDVLLTLDGTPLPDRETYNRLMAAKHWGDAARFTVQRRDATMELNALLRRQPEEMKAAEPATAEPPEPEPAPRTESPAPSPGR